MSDDERLTNNVGNPIDDDENTLTVGNNGPALLNDSYLLDKLASFDRERIPERVVHAKGSGAKGYFELTKCMKKYTKARLFTEVGEKTPVIVRFSTVIGFRGSADTARDPRGFATKFYTKEGNFDIVGNHIPIFFIRDSKKFPDLIHAFKPSPCNNAPDKNRFWDFVANNPESTNMITFVFTDIGTIKSFRTIEGFSVNTFVWVNEYGKRVFVKYHWMPELGVKTIDRHEAEMLAGIDPDVAVKDLYDCIKKGGKVVYHLEVQMIDECDINKFDFNPLDATQDWPKELIPFVRIGKMTLNENPKNFFGEIEQLAFSPANLIPGTEFSNDKLLQGRGFSYKDTERHRIGANFEQLPVNRPLADVNNNTQDGPMRYHYKGGCINYKKNSLNCNKPKVHPKGNEYNIRLNATIQKELIDKADDFKQAGQRIRKLNRKDYCHLLDNMASDMWCVDKKIQLKVIENFCKADKEFADKLKERLKI